jgi:hypothetical protein
MIIDMVREGFHKVASKKSPKTGRASREADLFFFTSSRQALILLIQIELNPDRGPKTRKIRLQIEGYCRDQIGCVNELAVYRCRAGVYDHEPAIPWMLVIQGRSLH